nr:uncharacterized protein LOC108077551 [Drosophila kikkawai]
MWKIIRPAPEILELSSGEEEEPDSTRDAIVISDEEGHDGTEAGPPPRYETPPPAYEVLFGPGPYPGQTETDKAGETTANTTDSSNGNMAHIMGASSAAAAPTGTTNATPFGDARVTGTAAGGPPAVILDTTATRAGGTNLSNLSNHRNLSDHSNSATTSQDHHTAATTSRAPDTDAGTAANTPGITAGQRTPPRPGQPDVGREGSIR